MSSLNKSFLSHGLVSKVETLILNLNEMWILNDLKTYARIKNKIIELKCS